MIVKYSKNIFQQVLGVVVHNSNRLTVFIVWSSIVLMCHIQFEEWIDMSIPMVPISILGGALAIFLGFRNSSAYDRWWEARKIWGGIVNKSRNFGLQVLTYPISDELKADDSVRIWQKQMIYRHIAWLYALKSHLRKETMTKEVMVWLSEEERKQLESKSNIPVQLIKIQGESLRKAHEMNYFEQFRLFEMMHALEDFYDLQGMAERIKNTVFPFYYNYFTRLFLWVFVIFLPFGLVHSMGWVSVPMSVVISFIFGILEKSGSVTEDPFEGRAADTPMQAICRTIEIDLKEMLEDKEVPEPTRVKIGRFKVEYQL